MFIQIHKNKIKRFFEMKWDDVPEFLLFETDPSNYIAVKFETEDELKNVCKNFKKLFKK
jgi:hypothetical protein